MSKENDKDTRKFMARHRTRSLMVKLDSVDELVTFLWGKNANEWELWTKVDIDLDLGRLRKKLELKTE